MLPQLLTRLTIALVVALLALGAGRTAAQTPAPAVVPPDPNCHVSFSDVPASYWAAAYVNYLACQHIVSGYGDGTFQPESLTTRGQFTKMIVLSEGWELLTPDTPTFSDVPKSNTFYGYVETAFAHGVISGFGAGKFSPTGTVTRGQVCKIVVRARGWDANPTSQHFMDVPPSNTFYAYVETAVNHGVVTGFEDGTFRWSRSATRAQISKIIYNALNAQD